MLKSLARDGKNGFAGVGRPKWACVGIVCRRGVARRRCLQLFQLQKVRRLVREPLRIKRRGPGPGGACPGGTGSVGPFYWLVFLMCVGCCSWAGYSKIETVKKGTTQGGAIGTGLCFLAACPRSPSF